MRDFGCWDGFALDCHVDTFHTGHWRKVNSQAGGLSQVLHLSLQQSIKVEIPIVDNISGLGT